MSEKRGFDVVVVGGGVIGLACAWRLAQRGAEVAVLERSLPGSGATRVAAGMLAPVGELTFGEPELLELTLAAARLYPEFVAELEAATGTHTGYQRLGALHVALDRDEAAQLRRVHDLQRSLDLEAEWLSTRRCRELEPGLAPSFHGGVLAAGEAAVNPWELARALVAACAGEGVEIRPGCEAVDSIIDGGRIVGVRAKKGAAIGGPHYAYTASDTDFYGDMVLLAGGAWSGAAPWLPEEARPPVRPVKGEVVELRSRGREPVADHILASERVYLVPRSNGHLVVGATVEERGFDPAVSAGGVFELLREAYRLLPEVAEMDFVRADAGFRPGTPNNLPLVGPGAIEGLVLATGHFRNGILLAPLAAEAVAGIALGWGVAR